MGTPSFVCTGGGYCTELVRVGREFALLLLLLMSCGCVVVEVDGGGTAGYMEGERSESSMRQG